MLNDDDVTSYTDSSGGYVTNGPMMTYTMTSRSLVTLRRYICRHRTPRMREIFSHVTAVIRRIAHACVATWRRVMLHASLVLQSTDHSSSSSSTRRGLAVTCSRQACPAMHHRVRLS